MATSIFDKKEEQPTDNDIKEALKKCIDVWDNLIEYLKYKYECINSEWKFYSANAGWCLRISNKKGKNILFLLPNSNYFIATVNMSVKVKEEVLVSSISKENKMLIEVAKVYMEGLSVLFPIIDKKDIEDIKTILSIRDKSGINI